MLHTQDRHYFIARTVKHDGVAVNDHFTGATDAAGTVQRRALAQAVNLGADLIKVLKDAAEK